MTSPNNTLIGLGQSITDASGNVWTIKNGQVIIDGTPDPTTANVTHLAYADGVVWQENSDNLWWSKTSPTASWQPTYGTSVVPVPVTASANDTVISVFDGTLSESITDASGNIWGITNGQVTVNGIADPTTANVSLLAYVNGQVWQENTSDLWWSKTTPASTWGPTNGTSAVPLPAAADPADPSGSVLGVDKNHNSNAGIVDTSGNTWVISNGQVVVNNVIDPTTANVVELAYVDGKIWQENASGLWWSKSAPANAWSPTYGTSINPLQNGAITIINSGDEATTINIGQMSQSIQTPPGLSVQTLVTTGIEANGTALVFNSFSGETTLVVDGNSSISATGSLLVREFTEGQTPDGPLQNNGTMTLNDSTLTAGTLSGKGLINATNGSTVNVGAETSTSETIHLLDSHLNINENLAFLSTTSRPVTFDAPISMGIGSGVSLTSIQATAADFNPATGVMLLWAGNSTSGYQEVADLKFVGVTHVYASAYAATASSPGGTLLSPEPIGSPLLPPTS